MSTTPAVNDTLIREVVEEVIGRLGQLGSNTTKPVEPAPIKAVVPTATRPASRPSGQRYGIFQDAKEACEAGAVAFRQLQEKGVAGRSRVIEIVKTLAEANSAEWGRIELEETKIGRLDHKIEKLKIIKLVPGVEFLHPTGLSGDHGITLEEYTPFGVVGAVTPSTHSIPTISGNVVNMVAAGNAVVFNPHPGACRCAAVAVRAFNEAIYRALDIENLICLIEKPTIESFKAISASEHVGLLCVTGGPGVVKAAMQTGKRAICAGPGNPPVLVDDTADLDRAARCCIQGAAYDNNLLCIGEKEVFALENIADGFMSALERHGAFRLNPAQLERLTKEAFTCKPGEGAGCGHATLNKDLVGKDATYLARLAGASAPAGTELLFAETDETHVFVQEEQMMPFLPVVRVKDVTQGIVAAKKAEHNYRHTAIIHSHNVTHMTAMARALETTLFVKNGASVAGLGLGGEGYLSYSIATPTGEGITNPKTFTRVRRCVMVDNLRIY
ncbi:MAG: aldehyde dehydrogenase EutE [Candidatus Omnitrophica bacterium]|nr:aldehyde dehydrogenase EutE [Candidatus Omnitrophota bacterium]